MELNSSQKAAVDCREHCIVAAGPGSGKTRLIIEKAAELIRSGIRPEHIALVTFTRDAAGEMRQRLTERIGGRKADAVISGTFHSIALSQLERMGTRLRLATGAQLRTFYAQTRSNFGGRHSWDEIVKAVENVKTTPEPIDPDRSQDHLIAAVYDRLLHAHNHHDYFDILRATLEALTDGRMQPMELAHLMVDEFQDADPLQIAWTRHHLDAGAILTGVGDDDQSIYGWRNAQGFAGMEMIKAAYAAKTIVLDTNYRNPPALLAASTQLIEGNTKRIPKSFRAGSELQVDLRLLTCPSIQAEAEFISAVASEAPWAVLSRTAQHLDEIELHLALDAVPFVRLNGSSVFSSRSMTTFGAILGLTHKPSSRPLWEALSGLGTTKQEWEAQAGSRDLPANPLQMMELPDIPADTGEPSVDMVLRLIRYLGRWHGHIEFDSLDLALIGMAGFVSAHLKDENDRRRVDRVGKYLAAECAGEDLDDAIALFGSLIQAGTGSEDDGAVTRLMTLHRSKGLEFDRVWIPGVFEGHLPLSGSDIEEERRLLYVGLTRARAALIVSHPIAAIGHGFVGELESTQMPRARAAA